MQILQLPLQEGLVLVLPDRVDPRMLQVQDWTLLNAHGIGICRHCYRPIKPKRLMFSDRIWVLAHPEHDETVVSCESRRLRAHQPFQFLPDLRDPAAVEAWLDE